MKKVKLLRIFYIIFMVCFLGIINHCSSAEKVNEHGEENHVTRLVLTEQGIKIAGIEIDKAIIGQIEKKVGLSGEVGFNENKYIHVIPRFSGMVKTISKELGDPVREGEILATVESNESLASYPIRSSISGVIVKRNLALGEYVSENHPIYEIANLSTVWVNFAVYARDINQVKVGQEIEITMIGSDLTGRGKISYLAPVFDSITRHTTARVVLGNMERKWLPGSFVAGIIKQKTAAMVMVVKKDAVQNLDGRYVVFIPGNSREFIPVEVEVGDGDDRFRQIVKGIKAGQAYVSSGAFELKAELITGRLDSHAGHGH